MPKARKVKVLTEAQAERRRLNDEARERDAKRDAEDRVRRQQAEAEEAANLKRWGINHPGHVVDPAWVKAYEKANPAPERARPISFDKQLDIIISNALEPLTDKEEIPGGVYEDFRIDKHAPRALAEGLRTLINEVLDVVCEVTDHAKLPTEAFWDKLSKGQTVLNFLKSLKAAHDCAVSENGLDADAMSDMRRAALFEGADDDGLLAVFESADIYDQERFLGELRDAGVIPDPLTT